MSRFLFFFAAITLFAADVAQEGVRWWSHALPIPACAWSAGVNFHQ